MLPALYILGAGPIHTMPYYGTIAEKIIAKL